MRAMMINLGTNPLSPSPCTDGTSATISVHTPLCPQALTRVLDADRPRIALCMTTFEEQRGGKRPFFKARAICRGLSLPRLHGEPQIRSARATRVDDV